eukprot:296913-Chlamydomonas_euryale.AAC.4
MVQHATAACSRVSFRDWLARMCAQIAGQHACAGDHGVTSHADADEHDGNGKPHSDGIPVMHTCHVCMLHPPPQPPSQPPPLPPPPPPRTE